MFKRIRAIIKQNIIIIILEFNKLEPSSSIMLEGKHSCIILTRKVLACSRGSHKLGKGKGGSSIRKTKKTSGVFFGGGGGGDGKASPRLRTRCPNSN